MKSLPSKIYMLALGIFVLSGLAHCGKPRLFGKEMEIRPILKTFSVEPKLVLKSAKEALALQGYNLAREDLAHGVLETHWQSTTSDSHYVNFFNRQDRGTVGAYHKLIIKITPEGKKSSRVEIYSLAKSIISNVISTGIEEEKVLKKIDDFTRKQDIQVTNVGIQ